MWGESDESNRTSQALEDWNRAYDFWTSSKANRQINWDQLYYANGIAAQQGQDAMYYIQAKHNDALTLTFASTLNMQLGKNQQLNIGIIGSSNKGMHYQTMEDLLGASTYHNINTYALGTYDRNSDEIQYDLNHRDKEIGVGDRFGYDYNLLVNNSKLWASYSENFGILHYTIAAKLGYTSMQRDGKMRNGLAADNSYGKSDVAEFVDGGFKLNTSFNLGRGNTLTFGIGYEHRAPQARTAFASPEINNDFVTDLKKAI